MHRATVLCGDTIEPAHLALEQSAKTGAAGGVVPAAVPSSAAAAVPVETKAVPSGPVPANPLGGGPLKSQLDDLEKQRILATLAAHGGNQSRTAAALGMPRRTMIKRLEEYGIARPRKAGKPVNPDAEEQ